MTVERYGELVTQMHFPDEPLNGQDALYLSLPGDMARAAATSRFRPGGGVSRFAYYLVLA